MAPCQPSPTKSKSPKKDHAVASGIGKLSQAREAGLKKYGRATNTVKRYDGYFKNGIKWLAKLVEVERERGVEMVEGIPLGDLAVAFDNPPNRYSATALQLFLVEKCIKEGEDGKTCGKSVADLIHGAFARYWDRMDEQRYAGAYSCDSKTGKVRGCPARAPVVQDIMKAIKSKAASRSGATRQHAEAMKIEDLRQMMEWSEMQCPSSFFDNSPFNHNVLLEMNKHGFMRAFATTGFNLFTRNFETATIQVGDITFDCRGPAPYYHPHIKIKLEERKGWQKAAGYEGPRTSNTYDLPEMDIYTHLLRWLSYLQRRLGRPLKPDDYVFPKISVNGVINSKVPVPYDTVQNQLQDFVTSAGLRSHYTTHCFRRGGAQYRFMFAPVHERWSLSVIRWWGGWAKGEHADTLAKYLLDSLQSYEDGHANAMAPERLSVSQSFMGNQAVLRPASVNDLRQFAESLNRHLEETIRQLTSHIASIHMGTATMQPRACRTPSLSANPVPAPASHPPYHIAPASYPHYTPTSATPICNGVMPTPEASASATSSKQRKSKHINVPVAGVVIPDIKKGPRAWLDAVDQWEQPNAKYGRPALKDWPREWYTGAMSAVVGAKRGQRALVANEMGRDEEAFLAKYPEAGIGMKRLLQAIRAQEDLRRCSKNGTPSSRDEAQSKGEREFSAAAESPV